jgi:Flp pilus assembly protein TadD
MTHQQAHYVLGTALVRSGQAADGRAELATFERLQNEAAAARVRQLEIDGLQREATVSAAAGDETRAASLLRRAVTLDPESAPLHMDLGIALLQLGDHQGAVAELTQAAMLGAPFAVHQHLAAAYETAGRADDSRRERALYQQLKQESLRQRTAGR